MTDYAKIIRSAPVGKIVGGTLYIHSSAFGTLPPELQVLVLKARTIAAVLGYSTSATLYKIDRSGEKVSFLTYEDFDSNPHPPLNQSTTVNLVYKSARTASYDQNRPILHRKETFVAGDYPGYDMFAALTEAEEAEGLLGRSDIGREGQWADVLDRAGLRIVGHTLRRQ